MSSYATRLAKLERLAADLPKAAFAKDAAEFTATVIKLAEHFDEADAHIPTIERSARFSKAQELAWVMRFGTIRAFSAAISDALAFAKAATK